MQQQLQYKDEEKPSVFILILLSFIGLLCLVAMYFYFFSFDTETFFKTVLLLSVFIAIPFAWYKEYQKYKRANASKDAMFKEGKQYKGKIIRTEISAHTVRKRRMHSGIGEEVTVYEYYAVVEYINDKGETIQFTTPELNGNPEYLSTKEVIVYNMGSVNYATGFGFYRKPKEKISFRMDE